MFGLSILLRVYGHKDKRGNDKRIDYSVGCLRRNVHNPVKPITLIVVDSGNSVSSGLVGVKGADAG